MAIRDDALKWWGEQIKQEVHVVSSDEIPDRRQREFLVKEKFLHQASRGYWILKRPEDDIDEIFPLLYWQVVSKILSRYTGWSIQDQSALSIYAGNQIAQKNLKVRTKEKTNNKLSLPLSYVLSLTHDPSFNPRLIKQVDVAGTPVFVDVPEKVLADIGKLEEGSELSSFIAGTQFDLRLLEVIYATNPKPVVFNRLVKMAKATDRPDLVTAIEKIMGAYTHYKVAKQEASYVSPASQPTLAPPWVIRQENQAKEFEEVLENHLSHKIDRLKKYSLGSLLTQANKHKKYDTYHSTTLEGYQITPEEVDALLSGIVPEASSLQGNEYFDKLKNRMAILGYSTAFDFILSKIQTDFQHPVISEGLVKDTYFHLFKPSADAKIIERFDLVSYRETTVFIRDTRYVPPSKEKLPELMSSYVSIINKIRNPAIKAILAHYFFVTIHPYPDGNGRTARLLMNYFLMTSGYQWLTIRADQRDEYFDTLKAGQVDGDILPFGEFIVRLLGKI